MAAEGGGAVSRWTSSIQFLLACIGGINSTLVLHGLVKDCVNFSFVESARMVEGQTAHFCYFISPVVIFKCVCRLDRAAKINQSRGFAGVQKGKGFMCRDVISRVNLFDSRLRNSAGSLCSAEGSA